MRDGGAQREGAALEQRARSGVCVLLVMRNPQLVKLMWTLLRTPGAVLQKRTADGSSVVHRC